MPIAINADSNVAEMPASTIAPEKTPPRTLSMTPLRLPVAEIVFGRPEVVPVAPFRLICPSLAGRWTPPQAGPACALVPGSSNDSNRGGDTVRPVTATRTGPNACFGFSPISSTSACRSAASIASFDHSAIPSSAAPAASDDGQLLGAQLLLGRNGVDLDRLDEQELEHLPRLAQHRHPLLHERK